MDYGAKYAEAVAVVPGALVIGVAIAVEGARRLIDQAFRGGGSGHRGYLHTAAAGRFHPALGKTGRHPPSIEIVRPKQVMVDEAEPADAVELVASRRQRRRAAEPERSAPVRKDPRSPSSPSRQCPRKRPRSGTRRTAQARRVVGCRSDRRAARLRQTAGADCSRSRAGPRSSRISAAPPPPSCCVAWRAGATVSRSSRPPCSTAPWSHTCTSGSPRCCNRRPNRSSAVPSPAWPAPRDTHAGSATAAESHSERLSEHALANAIDIAASSRRMAARSRWRAIGGRRCAIRRRPPAPPHGPRKVKSPPPRPKLRRPRSVPSAISRQGGDQRKAGPGRGGCFAWPALCSVLAAARRPRVTHRLAPRPMRRPQRSWRKLARRAQLSPEGTFLRRLHKGACGIFGTVLGPEANEAHRDHFHLDLAPRRRSAFANSRPATSLERVDRPGVLRLE